MPNLTDLPEHLKKSFQPYTKADGQEIDLAKLPVNCPEKGMPLDAYPKAVQDKIALFDVNGDGFVEMHELERAAELYKESKNTSKRLGMLVVSLVVIIGVLVGVTAACTYAVVENAKETEASTDGSLHLKDKPNVIATTGVAETTEDIFDFITKGQADVAGVKELTLVTGTTTRQYTVTGYESKIGELSFFTATGHKVTVTPNTYSIYNANGSTLATVTKASSRRRSLLSSGGGSTVTSSVSSGGSAPASLQLFNPSQYCCTQTLSATVYLNGVLQTSGTLVAMVGTEIVGYSGPYACPPFAAASTMFLMTMYMHSNGGKVSFKYIEGSGTEHDMEITADGVSWDGSLVSNDSVGNLVNPLVVKSVPANPFSSYSDKMTLTAFLMLGSPSNYRVASGKFSAYSLEDGSLRGESTEPAAMWFGFYPIWSIDIYGNKHDEMIEVRFENDDGTYILHEKEFFRKGREIGTLEPSINPMLRTVKHVTVMVPPVEDVAPAMPKPTLPIDLSQFEYDATALARVQIDGMHMTSGTIVAYDGTTPLGATDNINKDPFGRHIGLFNLGGQKSTLGKSIDFYFWGNSDTCTGCEAIKLDIMSAVHPTFEQNKEFGVASEPLKFAGSSDPNFATNLYDNSMSLYAKVKIDGNYVTTGKLTAYDGNQVVGVIAAPSNPAYREAIGRPAPPVPGLPDGFFIFMIYHDSNYAQGITFKYTKPDGTMVDLNGNIDFVKNSAEYDLMNMVDLSN